MVDRRKIKRAFDFVLNGFLVARTARSDSARRRRTRQIHQRAHFRAVFGTAFAFVHQNGQMLIRDLQPDGRFGVVGVIDEILSHQSLDQLV